MKGEHDRGITGKISQRAKGFKRVRGFFASAAECYGVNSLHAWEGTHILQRFTIRLHQIDRTRFPIHRDFRAADVSACREIALKQRALFVNRARRSSYL